MNNWWHGNGKAASFGRKQSIVVLSIALIAVLAFTANSGAVGTFAPTITIETSTSRATAHPDARITVDNSASNENLKDLTIDLPDGFMGSLNSAPRCSVVEAQASNCPTGSAIGTVENYATVDKSDVKLRGTIYLTEALPPHSSDDPAGLQIVVPATIGGVTLDPVVVNARVQLRYAPLHPDNIDPSPGLLGPVVGVRTIVTDIPQTAVDSANSRTVEFTLKKLVVDLRSDQSTPYAKLLTNPSVCGDSEIVANATSYDASSASDSDTYTVDQCDSVDVGAAELSFTPSTLTPASTFQFSTTLTFAEDSPALNTVVLRLPPAIATNTPAFGDPLTDQCPISSIDASGTQNTFNPSECPAQAKVGTVEIETPLLPNPLEGELYFISAAPIPIIGLYVDPSTGLDNPAGVAFGIYGATATQNLAAACSPTCTSGLTTTFQALPDVPIKKITVTTDGTARGPLPGNFLQWAPASSNSCQRYDDVGAQFLSQIDIENGARPFAAIDPYEQPDCNAKLATMTSPPFGETASTNPPSFTYETVNTGKCAIDSQFVTTMPACNPSAGIVNYAAPSVVDPGLHYFFARPSTEFSWRAFAIQPDPPSTDVVPPTVTIDSGPTGTTSQSTPEWTFSSNEDSYFQCSVDDGAFLPCESGALPATTGSFETTTALFAGTQHKFAVRAQDEYGNVSGAEEVTIDVEIDFQPSLTTNLTTTQARAHPDLDVVIDNLSNEDVKTVKVGLPDGFFGGLTGVQSLCSLATAAAGNCTDASRVGTVETEARVDESLIRIDGEVYLTDSAHTGEPAGLSIKVPAVIQDVDLGDIIVSGRLQVRGQAQGIDSLVVDIPNSIVPNNPYGDTETFFDMRKITLKLRTGPGATHPLLTNPSSCNGSAFTANFTGYGSTESADANGFAATGCEALGFSPNLAMSVVDSTSGKPPVNGSSTKAVSANLTATLSANPGDAGIKDVSILMPRPLTINVLAIPPACKLAEYNDGAGQCPETSRVGSVSAVSPLLPEALTGSVYLLLQNDPARAVPRLLIALRGRINIDIIADNRFENGTQIRTSLTNLPDVPLSSFTLQVDKVLSTRNEACTVPADEWAALGQMAAFNGKSVPVNNQLVFGCKPKYAFTYRKRAKKTLLNVTAIGGPQKMRKLTVRLPKYVTPIKRGLKRRLVITADGKRLSRRCYKVSRKSLTVSLCGKTASTVIVRFRSGSLSAGRKATTTKRLKKLSLWGADTAKKRIRFTK